ncbi:MAG: pyridoxamine 5'-phosphate oxidase family protein [Thermodesulfovibrionales bacterium]|nr:pyridoxamine 5'-phosphate oxidase family protein [Thermodesulfovibrionales bacterium]
MTLKEYFENITGTGILSSADRSGKVTIAIYSVPRVMDDGTVCFIMRERLTYKNLLENPHAAFMFIEDGASYRGIRLFLTKVREDHNEELIKKMTRRYLTPEEDEAKGPKHLVIFRVDKILPLIGDGDTGIRAI